MRRGTIGLLTLLISLLLAGCGGGTEAHNGESGLELKKNGKVVQTIAEEFSEEYYSEDELKEEAEELAAQYNQQNGSGSVKTEDPKVSDGVVEMTITYQDSLAYAGFNGVTFFAGKLEDASENGYSMEAALIGADGTAVSLAQLLADGEPYQVMVLEETGYVSVYGEILYYTENVTATGEKTAMVGESDGLSYLVFRS